MKLCWCIPSLMQLSLPELILWLTVGKGDGQALCHVMLFLCPSVLQLGLQFIHSSISQRPNWYQLLDLPLWVGKWCSSFETTIFFNLNKFPTKKRTS